MREIKFRDYDPEKKEIRYFDLDHYDKEEHNQWCNIMQYTGLKDKNGVEIYEGDIIVGQFGYKEVVKIEEFNFITREDSCAGYGFKLDSCNLDDIKKYVEVIGNIYENPELLDNDWIRK
jgi:uncharacterized phage protein (TIGR01671 family)